jgi:hypothetical protein
MPHVADAPTIAILAMLDFVLRNAAERTAHEIAWMIEEREEVLRFAEIIIASDARTPEVEQAVADAVAPASLNLIDVVDAYRRASEVLSVVLEATAASGNQALHHEAFGLLMKRIGREKDITLGWGEAEGLGATR